MPLPPHGTRIVDMLLIVVGIPVALVVCLPILVLTVLAGIPIGLLLTELGAPDTIVGTYGIAVFGAGLGLCFFVLLKLSRSLPAKVRAFAFDQDEVDDEPVPIIRRDPNADDASLDARLAAADAALAPDPAGSHGADSPRKDGPPTC